MAKIPEDIIRAVVDQADIVEVIDDFLGTFGRDNPNGIRKKGSNYTAICPFHEDHTDGNFIIRPKASKKNPNCYCCFTCDAKGGAVQFLMNYANMTFKDAIRYLGKKYSIPVDDIPPNYTPPKPKPIPPPLPTLVLPRGIVANRLDNQGDALCMWIRKQPWAPEQRARVEDVLKQYCVGHARVYHEWSHKEHHFTVFWQIDKDGKPRTGHYMKYKPNGHRMHKEDDRYNTDWFHAILSSHYDAEKKCRSYEPPYPYPAIYDPDKQEARQCLFGEHLLDRYPQAPVCIVESEKTAVLMAIAYGNHPLQLWMACCGSSNITRERLAPLIAERRRIILYPDRDGIEAWTNKAADLDYDRVTIDTRAVTKWWRPEDGEKADIADVVMRIIQQAAVADHTPPKELIDKLEKT